RDENDEQNNNIKFYGSDGNVNVYCSPGKISFVFGNVENSANQVSEATGNSSGFPLTKGIDGFGPSRPEIPQLYRLSTTRLDLFLRNSNQSAQIIGNEQQPYYENFYLNN